MALERSLFQMIILTSFLNSQGVFISTYDKIYWKKLSKKTARLDKV